MLQSKYHDATRVTMMNYPLQDHERYEILSLKLNTKKNRNPTEMTKGEEEELLQEITMTTGYPWFLEILESCQAQIRFSSSLTAFFRYPGQFLEGKIRDLFTDEKLNFFTLVLIMKDGFIEERPVNPPQSPQSPEGVEMLTLAKELGIQEHLVTPVNLQTAAKEMEGEYVSLRNKRFVFVDNSVTEAICHVLLNLCPSFIKVVPISFLVHRTTLNADRKQGKYLLEGSTILELLKERFLEEKDTLEIIQHDGFTKPDFVKVVFRELKNRRNVTQYKDILLQAIHLQQHALVQEITRNELRTLPEGGESIKYLALEKACETGNISAFIEITMARVQPNHACMKACFLGRNREIISKLTDAFAQHLCKLSADAMGKWMSLVAEVGTEPMLRNLLGKLQGRRDLHQLATTLLETTVEISDYEKYMLTLKEADMESINWEMIITKSAEGNSHMILDDAMMHINDGFVNLNTEDVFVAACKANRKQCVEYLVQKYPNIIDMTNESNETPLHFAATSRHLENAEVLQYLIGKKDWLPNRQDVSGTTALHIASYKGNIVAVETLLNAGFKPDVTDRRGNTALHLHLKGDFINEPTVFNLLYPDRIKRCRRPAKHHETQNNESILSIQNTDGDTPLHLLCMNEKTIHVSILLKLVQSRKDALQVSNNKGQTPLHVLVQSSSSQSAVNALLRQMSNITTIDRNNNTVLHDACLKGNTDILKSLLLKLKTEGKQIFTLKNADGKSPLHCYVSGVGNKEVVETLSTTDNISMTDGEMKTPLHIAVAVSDNTDVVESLLDAGADVNASDQQARTPLHILCDMSAKCSPMLELLLLKDANIFAKDTEGQTPLHLACLSEGTDSPDVVHVMLTKGANLLDRDHEGKTPLHNCCIVSNQQSPRVVTCLLEHLKNHNQTDIGLSSQDSHGDTPLHKLCFSQGDFVREVAEIMIEKGADVSLKNHSGDTVLDIARKNQIDDLIQLIVKTAVVDACKDRHKLQTIERILAADLMLCNDDEDQLTRLFQAAVRVDGANTTRVLEILLNKGADAKFRGEGGLTAIHLAGIIQGEFTEDIICYLISKGIDVGENDDHGETVLHKVCMGETENSVKLTASLIRTHGLSPRDTDRSGNNPLHKLYMTGKLSKYYRQCMEVLVSQECPVDAVNSHRETPCHLAKQHGRRYLTELFEVYCSQRVLNAGPLQLFVQCGADVNNLDDEGNTVLHRVCRKRVTWVCNNIRLLLEAGCDKFLYNKAGQSAFDVACATGLDEDVRELTVTEEPDEIQRDGASGLSTPTSPGALPCPDWFRRSSSTESWEGDFRRGMQGIRNAAGLPYFDDLMEDFERVERRKMRDFFKRNM